MYCKILADSIRELQGKNTEEELATTVDLNVNAFIPDRYIRANNVRIDMYKRIATVENEDDVSEITDELIDRFGDIPPSVINLLKIAEIKALAHNIGITDVMQKDGAVLLIFADKMFRSEYVQLIMKEFSREIVIAAEAKPTLKYKIKDSKGMLSNIKFLLQRLNSLHSGSK